VMVVVAVCAAYTLVIVSRSFKKAKKYVGLRLNPLSSSSLVGRGVDGAFENFELQRRSWQGT
jgi:hypothetical protein